MIGKNSSEEVGYIIIKTIKEVLDPLGIRLAVQGCEHLNRALAVERSTAQYYQLEEVAVVPALHAGGACSVAAFRLFVDPLKWSISLRKLASILVILPSACMSNTYRSLFGQVSKR